jgi:hypothetical protein
MKKNLTIITIVVITMFATVFKTKAQDVNPLDTLIPRVEQINSDLEFMKKLKFSGYIQTQFQIADSTGIPSFAGGNFPAGVDKRFSVRRGRIKLTYDNNNCLGVLQFDITEKGLGIKDAYLSVKEPFLNAFGITMGVFNRPFGYEIAYSSSNRETPERSRTIQTLFPGERDLGAMLFFQMPKTSKFSFLRLEGGMFNGNAINPDFDKQKDFIGHLIINKTTKSEKIKFGIGASYYNGGVYQWNKFTYKMGTLADGGKGFVVDSTAENKGKYAERSYIGADFQLSIDWIGGITTLRGEYITGTQPGSSSSSTSPNFAAAPTAYDTYNRKFDGAYFYFVQNILHSKHDIVVKYDWYDPNTEVVASDIMSKTGTDNGHTNLNTKITAADIKFTTIGLGYIFHWNNNVKVMAYYDMVTNETTKVGFYTKDIKDNVFTLRFQYKF